jgi:hypothetical protein
VLDLLLLFLLCFLFIGLLADDGLILGSICILAQNAVVGRCVASIRDSSIDGVHLVGHSAS